MLCRKRTYLVSLFFLLSIAGKKSFAQQKDTDAFLKGIMQKEHIPGLAYAIIKDGKILKTGTFGKANLQWNASVTNQTVFQLASCSKLYAALLLGKLFDNEILNPDHLISAFIDSIPESWKQITILQLASHQSGIKIADFSKTKTSKEALELAKTTGMEYEPGTKSAYVSSDYWVLQYIIEKVTGMKYFDALKKYVLIPLNLTHTFVSNLTIDFTTTYDIIPQQAQEYHWWKNDSSLRASEFVFYPTSYAAGGIYTSIDDFVKVAIAIDKGSFISAKTKKLITNPVLLKNGEPGSYGLGLVNRIYEGYQIVEHSGGPALADFVRFEKEKLTFIVLTNNRGLYPYLSKALASLYLQGLPIPEVPKGWE